MISRAERQARRHSQPLPQLAALASAPAPRPRLSVDARHPTSPPAASAFTPVTPTKDEKVRPGTSASATQAANEIDLPTLGKDGGTGVRRVDRRTGGIRGKPRAFSPPPPSPPPSAPPAPRSTSLDVRRASFDVRREERRRERERRTRSMCTPATVPPSRLPSPLVPQTPEEAIESEPASPRTRMLKRLRVQAVGLVVQLFAGPGRSKQ